MTPGFLTTAVGRASSPSPYLFIVPIPPVPQRPAFTPAQPDDPQRRMVIAQCPSGGHRCQHLLSGKAGMGEGSSNMEWHWKGRPDHGIRSWMLNEEHITRSSLSVGRGYDSITMTGISAPAIHREDFLQNRAMRRQGYKHSCMSWCSDAAPAQSDLKLCWRWMNDRAEGYVECGLLMIVSQHRYR